MRFDAVGMQGPVRVLRERAGEIYAQSYGRRDRGAGREDRPHDGKENHECRLHGDG